MLNNKISQKGERRKVTSAITCTLNNKKKLTLSHSNTPYDCYIDRIQPI